MIALETAAEWALRNWKAVLGGLAVLALVAALLITRHTLADRTKDLTEAREWQGAVRSAVSRAADVRDAKGNPGLLPLDRIEAQAIYLGKTIDAQRAALDAKNAETEARSKALADSSATDAANTAKNDARQRGDSRSAALDALAAKLKADPACRVPAALVANLEGL